MRTKRRLLTDQGDVLKVPGAPHDVEVVDHGRDGADAEQDHEDEQHADRAQVLVVALRPSSRRRRRLGLRPAAPPAPTAAPGVLRLASRFCQGRDDLQKQNRRCVRKIEQGALLNPCLQMSNCDQAHSSTEEENEGAAYRNELKFAVVAILWIFFDEGTHGNVTHNHLCVAVDDHGERDGEEKDEVDEHEELGDVNKVRGGGARHDGDAGRVDELQVVQERRPTAARRTDTQCCDQNLLLRQAWECFTIWTNSEMIFLQERL